MSNVLTTVTSPKNLATYLEQPGVLASLAKSAAQNIDPQRVGKIACRIVADPKNRALLNCEIASVFGAIAECISLGLEPRLGRGYFVPYGRQCNFILGYQGMLDLARNGGVTASANVVFEGDTFRHEAGTDEKIIHVPDYDAERSEKTFKLAYVVSRHIDGETLYTVMTKREIDAIRARSKAGNSGPWCTDYLEMAKKTVIRRAAKNWPLSVEAARAIERDDERTFNRTVDIVANANFSATERLKETILEPDAVADTEPESSKK